MRKKIEKQYEIEKKKLEIKRKIDEQAHIEKLTKYNNIYTEKMKNIEKEIQDKRNESKEKIEQIKLEQKRVEYEIEKIKLESQKNEETYQTIMKEIELKMKKKESEYEIEKKSMEFDHQLKLMKIENQYEIEKKKLDLDLMKLKTDEMEKRKDLELKLKVIDKVDKLDEDFVKNYFLSISPPQTNTSLLNNNYQQFSVNPQIINNNQPFPLNQFYN